MEISFIKVAQSLKEVIIYKLLFKSAYKAIDEIILIINKIKNKKLITYKQENQGRVYFKKDFNVKYLRLVYNFFDDKIVDLYINNEINPDKTKIFQIKE